VYIPAFCWAVPGLTSKSEGKSYLLQGGESTNNKNIELYLPLLKANGVWNLYPIPKPGALFVLVLGRSYPIIWVIFFWTEGNLVDFPKLYFCFDFEKFIASNWVTNPPKDVDSKVYAI
jgi:hypothetical protein